MSLDNPVYYTGDTVEITGNPTSSKTLYRNAGISTFADVFVNTIDELKFKDIKKTTLKFIAKNAAGNVITKSYEVIVNPDNQTFTVPGVAADLLGSTAVSVAVGGALTLAVGPGAAIIFAAAGSVFLWDAIKDVDVVDDFFDELNNTVDTNIELAGLDGKTIGGVFYKKGLDQDDELQAIKQLLGRTVLPDFPDVSIGTDSIRVVNDANIDASDEIRDTYKIYDGELVDIIASEFNIIREELLFLGAEDGPNINREIQYNNQINPEKFVFANAENRFYVPLPVANSGEINVTGFHPGNIYHGTNGNDDISVFENNTSFNSELETDNTLILGLEGDDFLSADVGTNFIFGGSGNDNISGIAGEDTVYFTDDFANYDYSIDDNGVITFAHARGTQADGTDTLIDIEQAQFKDQIVSLPLEEPQTEPGSVSELEDGSVTFKFKTTLDESQSSTFIGLPPEIVGTNPEIELTYTFTPTQTRFGFTGLAPVPSTYNRVTGSLRINNQTTVLDYGDIKVSDGKNNDGYNVSFIPRNDASLFGYDIGRIALDISDGSYFDNNGDFIQGGTIFNSISIPTDAQFANKDSLFFDLLITANAPRNEVENSIFVSVNERASSSERTPFTLTSDNSGEETSDEISEESTTEESTTEESPEEPIDEENSESEQPPTDEKEIVEPPVNEDETDLEDPDSLIGEVPGNNSPINNSQETEIQLQLYAPDLESPVTEPLISAIRIPDEYTELSTLGLDTSDLAPVDVNIDIDLGAGSVPGRISFEVDENEGSGSFAPGEFNGYVFTDVFDEIPAIENVTLSETANSLGLESSDITFTENTIEVNVESLAYSPGLNALLDVEFADL